MLFQLSDGCMGSFQRAASRLWMVWCRYPCTQLACWLCKREWHKALKELEWDDAVQVGVTKQINFFYKDTSKRLTLGIRFFFARGGSQLESRTQNLNLVLLPM